jgi:hypothetical protein
MILAGRFTDRWAYLAAPVIAGILALALYDKFLRTGTTPQLRNALAMSPQISSRIRSRPDQLR